MQHLRQSELTQRGHLRLLQDMSVRAVSSTGDTRETSVFLPDYLRGISALLDRTFVKYIMYKQLFTAVAAQTGAGFNFFLYSLVVRAPTRAVTISDFQHATIIAKQIQNNDFYLKIYHRQIHL